MCKMIGKIKRQPGREILMFGSHTLWTGLLVDELDLIIGPYALGADTPIFEHPPATLLHLIDTRTWEGSGNALVRYGAA